MRRAPIPEVIPTSVLAQGSGVKAQNCSSLLPPAPSPQPPAKRVLGQALVLATLLSYVAPPSAWGMSFSIEPARVELSVPAGKQRGKVVRLNNTRSNAPLHVKVYVQDVVFLPDGTSDFLPSGSTDWSCASWIRFAPQELDIPAGRDSEVRVSVMAPPNAQGGHYAVVFFEASPSYQEEGGVGVNFRLGAFTEVVVPKTEVYRLHVGDLAVSPTGEVKAGLFNDGNVLVRPKGRVKVMDGQGRKVAQLPFNPNRLGILPNTLRQFPMQLEPLRAGNYRLRTEIDYGAPKIAVGECSFTID